MLETRLRFVCLMISSGAAAWAQAPKHIQTQAEYALYEAVASDFNAGNFAKAITDLNAWQTKYPDSEVKDARQFLYVQAYASSNQPLKVLDAARPLLQPELTAALDSPADIARLLYSVSVAIQQISAPADENLALGERAARLLAAFDQIPAGVSPEEWAKTRRELHAVAQAASRFVALNPAADALAKRECGRAETAARKALEQFPSSAQAAWYLGAAAQCEYRNDPSKASLMLYEYARAASLDPVQGAIDPKWQQATVDPHFVKLYNEFHGADAEGLRNLRQEALKSPLPPDGFVLKSKAELEMEERSIFQAEHPELTLWLQIKKALQSTGEAYFESDLKGVAVPALKGVVVEARPACRPNQLLVAIPMPDQAAGMAEIVLKLDKPIAGKPVANAQITWEGVPSVFSAEPFRLTMDVELAKLITSIEPCAGESPKRSGAK